jgi:hypothetical protein
VVRTADIQEDGKGDLYVAVFTQNPVDLNAPDDLLPVAQVLIEDIDFNIASSGAPYVLEGIEPQNQPFFAIAFFDDNDNLDPNDPGPDKGDLVSLDGLSGIEIYIDQPGDYSLDLELNAVMPMDL